MSRPTPDWILERIALGELPETEALPEADARNRIEAIHASNREILAAYPADRMGASIRERSVRAARWPTWQGRGLRMGVAASALVLLVVALANLDLTGSAPTDEIRAKGLLPHLVVHRSRASGVERLSSGDLANEGDRIQLSYVAAGRSYGLILSIDGRGVVTLHHPDRGQSAAPLQSQGATPLDFSYELDDAPEGERFFFITSDEPFEVNEVLEAASRVGSGNDPFLAEELPIGTGFVQHTFFLRKPGTRSEMP